MKWVNSSTRVQIVILTLPCYYCSNSNNTFFRTTDRGLRHKNYTLEIPIYKLFLFRERHKILQDTSEWNEWLDSVSRRGLQCSGSINKKKLIVICFIFYMKYMITKFKNVFNKSESNVVVNL